LTRILSVAIVKSEKSTEKVNRSLSDFVALSIATCGVGYIPIVPATWGSMVGVGVYLIGLNAKDNFSIWTKSTYLSSIFLETLSLSFTLIFIISLFLLGIWSANRVCKLTNKKDPRIVIIDEVVGQLITFMFFPAKLGWIAILVGFLTFRFFDILKPYPANKLEEIPGGLGVMADDAMAGFYAAATMSIYFLFFPLG
jgi:phosphatidylglycerophosphatase A